MSIMMAVDLLGCTGSTEERAALLHKTIQLAAELKSNLGNMFGFAAVMRALELPQVRVIQIQIKRIKVPIVCKISSTGSFPCHPWPQISRLEQTWVTLRQRHTEGAILYEKKLKPFMKNMNDGKGETALACVSYFTEKRATVLCIYNSRLETPLWTQSRTPSPTRPCPT